MIVEEYLSWWKLEFEKSHPVIGSPGILRIFKVDMDYR
jgi:hypothetical protein